MKLPTMLFASLFLVSALAVAEPKFQPDSLPPDTLEQQTRVQVFLDNENFGPGKIDGREGEFTRKALALYRQAHGSPAGTGAALDLSEINLESVGQVFTTYTVSKEDVAAVGEVPKGPQAQAKLKWLPYGSVAEAIAEKFHSDLDFLKELNPGKTDNLKEGDHLTVPNVKPFELDLVNTLTPGSAKQRAANDIDDNSAPDPRPEEQTNDSPLAIRISIKESMLEVREGEKLLAAFPVTIGSEATESPVGHWKVKGVAKLPEFRHDEKMLQQGERSAHFHLLPPGPNNPVGVLWIALNKKGIGIHGTDSPDSIGRSASHGCIRLANWDVVKLAAMVKVGVPVTIE